MSSTKINNKVKDVIKASFLGDLLKDIEITDISFNASNMYAKHNSKGLFKTDYQPTVDEVTTLIRSIANVTGKKFTTTDPRLNTVIGFFRINAIHDSLSPDGPTFALRVSTPKVQSIGIQDFIEGNIKEDISKLFKLLVGSNINILISGETGSGKTEFQKQLVKYILDNQKITLIEDTRDSHIKSLYPEKDINSWQSRTDNDVETKTTISELMEEALRNNPDWILISEIRKAIEAIVMIRSSQTSHNIMTTLHADSGKGIIYRIAYMVLESLPQMEFDRIVSEIVRLFPIGVHMETKTVNNRIVRSLKEVIEFKNYNDGCLDYTYLYRKYKEYDSNTENYILMEETNPISEKLEKILVNNETYHLLPNCFREKVLL